MKTFIIIHGKHGFYVQTEDHESVGSPYFNSELDARLWGRERGWTYYYTMNYLDIEP